ncbi:MAG: DUF4093 domain-containing protein, partial [Eubacterium sp.]|nr:DUF4093 domain-containing protein [Eubacterium sp.]
MVDKAQGCIGNDPELISMDDLFALGLAGDEDSAKKREKAGEILGIGYGNTKAFLKRLRFMGISREKLKDAL